MIDPACYAGHCCNLMAGTSERTGSSEACARIRAQLDERGRVAGPRPFAEGSRGGLMGTSGVRETARDGSTRD